MADKQYRVIAKADTSGDKLKGCRIVEELADIDTGYVHVHGPFPKEQCRRWAQERCEDISEG